MEPTEILEIFGVTIEQVAVVSAIVMLVLEFLKGQFPTFFNGWKTVVAAFVIGFAASLKLVYPDWGAMIALTVAAYILPAGAHKIIKRVMPNA